MSGACFFIAPIWLNLTTNTPIPECSAKFLFLVSNAKYWWNFPRPRGIHLKPGYTRHWPNQTSVRTILCLHCHHFFISIFFCCWCILMYIVSLLSKFCPRTKKKKYPAPRENSQRDLFHGFLMDHPPELGKIPPCDPNFFGVVQSSPGIPRQSRAPHSSLLGTLP